MSSAFDSIKLGLQEAINHAKGHEPDTRIHRPPRDPALVVVNVIAHNPQAVIDALA